MNIEQARYNMLHQQIRAWGVIDQTVLDLLELIPREQFVPEDSKNLAFADVMLPIGHGQFMLTPKEEGRILQALQIKPTDRVLEMGTGSGYLTALLAKLAKHVISLDIFSEFTQQAGEKLKSMGIDNVELMTDKAISAWTLQAPYDVIVITGSLPFLPENFKTQLAANGRLFAVIGEAPAMQAQLVKRLSDDKWHKEVLFETVVPSLLFAERVPSFSF